MPRTVRLIECGLGIHYYLDNTGLPVGRDIWTRKHKTTIDGEQYPFDRRDPNHKCEDCGRPIKARLVKVKKEPPKKCYKCYCRAKGQLTGQERRRLRKVSPLKALGEQAQ